MSELVVGKWYASRIHQLRRGIYRGDSVEGNAILSYGTETSDPLVWVVDPKECAPCPPVRRRKIGFTTKPTHV